MRNLHTILAVAILSATLSGGVALAQDHHDNHAYVEHKDWKRGGHLHAEDWNRGERIDYRQYRLAAPPRGYDWRMVDGQYVLANTSNFQIRTVVRIP